jgi:hypothetical protein
MELMESLTMEDKELIRGALSDKLNVCYTQSERRVYYLVLDKI